MADTSPVHVAAAAVFDAQGRVLITRRATHVHQGGLWEFPGGKVEAGEHVRDALARELHEELGIEVRQARPLIRVLHDYADKSVLLDVWRVDAFSGTAHGREGQPLKHVSPESLKEYAFPAANAPIVSAVQLPNCYLITPEPGDDWQVFLLGLESALQRGIRLVQLRAKSLSTAVYVELAKQVKQRCQQYGARLLLNADPALVSVVGADGVHLSGERLNALQQRPLDKSYLLGASCHSRQDIEHASKVAVDFAVLSPVAHTASHPHAVPLGWAAFQALADGADFPVYALGGMEPKDLDKAYAHGAQGIAAIRALWASR